ncbi:MAG: hypothetical protein KIS88_10665 [Anaerolineales bacterium]|nr:hypothetical protein [Anaerolineales bacterium]
MGEYLVRELGFADRGEILGRWMAHLLAEKINEAKLEMSKQKRQSAQNEAVKLISNIWKQRANLPGNAYPLSRYKDAVNRVESFDKENNPFSYARARKADAIDSLSAGLFDKFNVLIIGLLLVVVDWEGISSQAIAKEALSLEERKVLRTYEELEERFRLMLDSKSPIQLLQPNEAGKRNTLSEASLEAIDDLSDLLDNMRSQLRKVRKKSSKRIK